MPATAEEQKAHAIQELRAARQAVLDAAASLTPDVANIVFLGEWSANDIIAHLIGWDYANAEAVRAVLAGELPAFYAHKDPNWRAFNAELVRQYRHKELEDGWRAALESHEALCALLEAIPAAEFGRDYGVRFRGYKVTIPRLLASESADELIHAEQLRAFRQSRSGRS